MFGIVYDYETIDLNKNGRANKETSDIVQVAACPLDLKRLKLLEDESINIIIRPKDINSKTFYEDHSQVIKFHCDVLNKTYEELVEHWKMGIKEEEGFKEFIRYCEEFKVGSKPIAIGYNSRVFDNTITERKCKEYKKNYPFYRRDQIDVLELAGWYLRFATKKPRDHRLETILRWFGVDPEGAHDADVDVLNTGQLALKFLTLQHNLMNTNANWVKVMNGANRI